MHARPCATGLRAALRGRAVLWALLTAFAALSIAQLDPSIEMMWEQHRHLLIFDITQSMNAVDEPLQNTGSSESNTQRQTRLDKLAAAAVDSSQNETSPRNAVIGYPVPGSGSPRYF